MSALPRASTVLRLRAFRPQQDSARPLSTQKAQRIRWDLLGLQFWRRPTLARPSVALPSGLQRFTAVFGMGTGGATAL